MKLVHEILDIPLDIYLGEICNVCFENKLEYRKIVENIERQEILKIYNQDKIVISYHIIYDIYNLNYNSSKILNKIIKDLVEISITEDNYVKKFEIDSEIRKYLIDLIIESDYPIEIDDELDLSKILKACGIKILKEYDNFLEKIIDYLDLYNQVLGFEIFYIVNLLENLTEEEVKGLKEFLSYRNILLVNLENTHSNQDIDKEVLVDKDLCRII